MPILIGSGLVLAAADVMLPGPAPDGVTVLGLAMIALGLAVLVLLRSPEGTRDDRQSR